MSVGVGLIGGGIWAREEHAPAIYAAKELSLKAVFSRSLNSAKSIADGAPNSVDLYSDDSDQGYDEILKRPDITAVIISLPIKNQAEYIRKALLAGKHVLSEKPVSENVKEAEQMIEWYRSEIQGPTWCVAENWRFLASYEYAQQEIKTLGKITGFQGRQHSLMPQSAKWYKTEWRKDPTHQGGFLLDGGVHYMAGIRQLLAMQPGNNITRISAFTTQLQEHLPPVDTANVILKTTSSIIGSFQISVGTTLREDEWTVACQNGWIKVEGSIITISRDGKVTQKAIPNERTGVPTEVRAWGEALVGGAVKKELQPEAALADLELLELILKSGEQNGTPLDCVHQNV